jgi:hypothetical protein
MPGLLDDAQPIQQPRWEPKVGTRSPLPQGGGGGLSNQAVLQALAQQRLRQLQMQQQMQQQSMGALPANPVTDPQAILNARMQAAGV